LQNRKHHGAFNTAALTRLGAMAGAMAGIGLSAAGAQAASPIGVWVDPTGRGAVEIKQCGRNLCGIIVWARKSADARRGCGRKMMGGLTQIGRGQWDNGWIISPDEGTKYDLAIKPLSASRLEVMGYAGTKFLSRTMVWTRAPAGLRRCDQKDEPVQVLAKGPKPPVPPSSLSGPLRAEASVSKPGTRPVTASETADAPNEQPASNSGVTRVFYTPPRSAPAPIRKPSTILTALAVERAVDASGASLTSSYNPVVEENAAAIQPPAPRLLTQANVPVVSVKRVSVLASRDGDGPAGGDDNQGELKMPTTCKVAAPFVLAFFPCLR